VKCRRGRQGARIRGATAADRAIEDKATHASRAVELVPSLSASPAAVVASQHADTDTSRFTQECAESVEY